MSKKVTITFSFIIPKGEIADVDMPSLKEFIKEQIGVIQEGETNQFNHYSLSDFNPKIIEQRFENV